LNKKENRPKKINHQMPLLPLLLHLLLLTPLKNQLPTILLPTTTTTHLQIHPLQLLKIPKRKNQKKKNPKKINHNNHNNNPKKISQNQKKINPKKIQKKINNHNPKKISQNQKNPMKKRREEMNLHRIHSVF